MSTEKRMLVAVAVSFVVIVIWTVFMMPPQQEQPAGGAAAEQAQEQPAAEPEDTAVEPEDGEEQQEERTQPDPEAAEAEPQEQMAAESEQQVTVETSRFTVTLTNAGGGSVLSWKIKRPTGEFYESSFSEEPLDLLADPRYRREDFLPFATMIRNEERRAGEGDSAPTVVSDYKPFPGLPELEAVTDGGVVTFVDGVATVGFTYFDENFGRVIKEFTFRQDSYVVEVRFLNDVTALRGNNRLVLVIGPGVGDLVKVAEDGTISPGGEANGYLWRKAGGGVERANSFVTGRDAPGENEPTLKEGRISDYLIWAGLENKYFMKLFFGDNAGGFVPVYRISSVQQVQTGDKTTYLTLPYLAVHTDNSDTRFRLFVGPKDLEVLETAANGRLKDVVSFGWFAFVSRPALWILKQIYGVVHNYGVAIIILTILINILLLPLIIKQRQSMAAMQKLQPQIKSLQAKYKVEKGDDIKTRQAKKQKLNEEMMALYKAENVNPMGGCLPLLIQLPILIALFDMIRVAIELRKAPFFLWWQDLSTADPTFILPILMGVAMFVTQKLTPTPTDQQTGALKFLPFIFVFLFAQAPSGLVLYWTTSSVFNMGTQLVMGQVAAPVVEVQGKGRRKDESGKGSKKKSRDKK